MKKVVFFLALAFVVAACNDEDEVDYMPIDIALIDEFLADNNIDAVEHESGLRYVIHDNGDGDSPTCIGEEITANYVGMLLGRKDTFDTSYEEGRGPFTFSYFTGSVIAGWDIGFGLLQEGDSASFFIPSPLGYGSNEIKGDNGEVVIPANSPLEFTVKFEKLRKCIP